MLWGFYTIRYVINTLELEQGISFFFLGMVPVRVTTLTLTLHFTLLTVCTIMVQPGHIFV